MATSRHKNLNPQAPEQRGGPVEIASYGGQAFVVNTNSASAASDPEDILEVLQGTSTARIIQIGGGSYLGLTHHWTDVVAASCSTPPVVRVFGKVRNPATGAPRYHPQDIDADFPDLHASGLLASDNSWDARGIWIPLTKPGYTMGTPELTLSGVAIRHLFNSDANQYDVSEEQYVFLAGVEEVLVVVSTAAAYTSGTDPKGVIVGRLFG